MTFTGSSGVRYQLDAKPLSDGGEGTIYRVLGGTDKKVAKIYKPGVLTNELADKLILMLKVPPDKNVLTQVAWPVDFLYDSRRQPCGFVMPQLRINAELGDVYKYNPGDPKKSLPISIQQKIIVAQNICAVITAVHNAGYVFGDFNPRNIALDTQTGTVAFLDTDSYHVTNPASNKVYRCNVCAPGYAAPELLDACSKHMSRNPNDKNNVYAKTPLPTFTKETDNFALAIHIFKLLVNGYTPFGGIPESASVSQASPGTGDTPVRRDNYCFKPGFKHQSAAILPLGAFGQKITDLFTRAFIAGKADPRQRPSAREWHSALGEFQKNLKQCSSNVLHQYDKRNASCPYCEADKRYSASIGVQFIPQTKPPPASRQRANPSASMPVRPPAAQSSVLQPPVVQPPVTQRTVVQPPAVQRSVSQSQPVQRNVSQRQVAQTQSAQQMPAQPAALQRSVVQPAASLPGSAMPYPSQASANTVMHGAKDIKGLLKGFMKKVFTVPGVILLLCLVLGVAFSLFNSGLFQLSVRPTGDLAAVSDIDNRYVRMVINGYRENNPNLTYDIAFSAYFDAPVWRYFRSQSGMDVVEFTGGCIYQNVPVSARIQFTVDEGQGTFEATFLAYNEVPQDARTLRDLIDAAFGG